MVLIRYWRREEDGSYFIMFQSTTHPECLERPNVIRSNWLGGGFVIAPQKSDYTDTVRSLVSHVVRYDPAG